MGWMCDFNSDESIDVTDLLTLVYNFGRLLEGSDLLPKS
jgi:hypothetical protein